MVPLTVVIPRVGSLALAFLGRTKKVQDPRFAVSAGRNSFPKTDLRSGFGHTQYAVTSKLVDDGRRRITHMLGLTTRLSDAGLRVRYRTLRIIG